MSANNNDPADVPTFLAYANGPGKMEDQSVYRYHACKNPSCDRYACTASAARCSLFCCPGCFDGLGHTKLCDENFAAMKARVVPDGEVIMSNEVEWSDPRLGRKKRDA